MQSRSQSKSYKPSMTTMSEAFLLASMMIALSTMIYTVPVAYNAIKLLITTNHTTNEEWSSDNDYSTERSGRKP